MLNNLKKTFFIYLTFIAAADAFLFKTKDWQVTAKGCVKCYNDNMSNVKVYLKDKDLILDDTMATSRADENGCFSMTGKGRDGFSDKPDPYIRVEYEYVGTYGEMEVEGIIFGINKDGNSKERSYQSTIDFGTLTFQSINCKAYVMFYKAMADFRARAQVNVPYKRLHVRTGVILDGGTPYSTTDVVRIPNNYPVNSVDLETAKHELAHTVRHSLDGSLAHFAWDATRFWYLRTHTCGTKSNEGYAFNEGWAEFWANECFGTYGGKTTDYEYEGNVANALRKLKSDCVSNDEKFIKVLKKGGIHSFSDFNNRHKELYGCKI